MIHGASTAEPEQITKTLEQLLLEVSNGDYGYFHRYLKQESLKVLELWGLAGNINLKHLGQALDSLLSRRQMDCLYYLILGMTKKQIAKKLNLSPKTIEHYLEIVKQKLNCHTKTELIVWGLHLPSIRRRLFCEQL